MRALLIVSILIGPLLALTLEEAIEKSLLHHPVAQQAEANLKGAQAGVGVGRAGFYPTLNVGGTQVEREHSGTQATQTLYARASINLFNGFRDRGILTGAKARALAASHERDAAREDIALQAKSAFFDYHRAAETLHAQEESMRAVAKQANDAQAFYDQGLIAFHELIVMRLEEANAAQRLLLAKSQLRLATLTLESLIGQKLPTPPQPVELGTLSLPPLPQLHSKLQNRSELQALKALATAQRAQKQIASSGFLPTVDASLAQESYEYEGGHTGLSDQQTLTLSLNWQIFGGFKSLNEREVAHYGVRQIESQIAETTRQMQLQLQRAYERLSLSIEALKVVAVALKAAEENYQVVNNRFEAQLASSRELIDAEAALSKAREQYILHYHDQLQALAELERITQSRWSAYAL